MSFSLSFSLCLPMFGLVGCFEYGHITCGETIYTISIVFDLNDVLKSIFTLILWAHENVCAIKHTIIVNL